MTRIIFITVSYLFLAPSFSHAQQLLRKTVAVNVKRQTVLSVLNEISRQGNFHFSYTSDVVRNDSLVTLTAPHKSVKQVLDMLFGGTRQYKEVGDHIIIQHITPEQGRTFTVSGYVKDRETGTGIVNATVYEKQQFISTLTNHEGYFRLRLKSNYPVAITISKDLYRDTTFPVHATFDQEMDVSIRPAAPVQLAPVDVGVEKTWLGHFFLSSKQRMQSINLNRFFADKPFQYSLVPGLGTHGKLDGQVINKFSINVIGGYAAGLNGFEIGTVFNINKKDAKGFQAAGVFNIVGGQVKGMQLAGVHNMVLDSLKGFQAAGVFNIVEGKVKGTQMAGVFNMAKDSVLGFQAAGVFNMAPNTMQGVQMSGVFNYADSLARGLQATGVLNYARRLKGVQISGTFNYADSLGTMRGLQVTGGINIGKSEVAGGQIGTVNYARHLKGWQIGVVNIADTSSGYTFGLINIVKKGGYYRVAVSTNEIAPWNLAVKMGNKKLYSIVTAGVNTSYNNKIFIFGYGLGHEWPLSQQLSITTDFTSQNAYVGEWDKLSMLLRLQPALNYRFSNFFTLFAGPAFSIYSAQEALPKTGYRQDKPGAIGWHAGISIF